MTSNRMRRPRWVIAVAAASLAALTGCTAAKPGDPVQQGPAASDPNVELRLTPTDLQNRLRVEAVKSGRIGGLMRGQVDLRNVSSGAVTVEYRAAWRDAAGFRIGSPDVWQPLSLGAGGMEELQFGAPSPAGARLVLQVRESD